jgi:hypothetical protein
MTGIINDENNLIPSKTLLVIPNIGIDKKDVLNIVEPLKKNKKRDWFSSHFYYCLPLIIGNTYGFIIKAENDFSIVLNNNLVNVFCDKNKNIVQKYSNHFGNGIFTIQNFFYFRTPNGVNLMTISPPNFYKHGICHLTGVIESDNLRRDFTFNIKVTSKKEIYFKKNEPIAAFIPIPRYFADEFNLKFADELFSNDVIQKEYDIQKIFSFERENVDKYKPHMAGKRYMKGTDAYGNKFNDHQK